MTDRVISIFASDNDLSEEICTSLIEKLESNGFRVSQKIYDAELLICVGGDGTTLHAIHRYGFPAIPIIGINTGHLGFFQEISPDQLDRFIYNYKEGRYKLQPNTAVKVNIKSRDGEYEHMGFNEIVIRGAYSHPVHLNISIGGGFIERFSGDGIIIATPVGSTAYNYSVGGSIVDPRLEVLQVTPISPMNTTAFRSFTSSVLLPSDMTLGVIPEYPEKQEIVILNDGNQHSYKGVESIEVGYSDTVVNLLRFEEYDFWSKVKSKFL